MHDFRIEHEPSADEYGSRENIWRKSKIKNNKLLKINLMKIIESSVKGIRKEHKKTGTKKTDQRNEVFFKK